jgi:RHS repeat-associated protein
MTTDETGRQFVYDAWNRLVTVKNSGGATLETFSYDGLNRRVTQTASGTTTDLFYSDQQQVLEEMVGGAATARYVWSPVYVNAMVLRDFATGSPGTLNQRLWVQQDANWNVTALVNGSGAVVERYVYSPYGVVTVLNASWSTLSGSAYAWVYGFQGMRYDATSGLNEADRRWYSPTQGRWVTMDPIQYAGGNVNLYGFVGNGPIEGLDPSGLAELPKSKWPSWVRNLPGQTNGSAEDDEDGGSYIEEVTRVNEDFQHQGGGHYDIDYKEEGTGDPRTQRYHRDGTPFTDEENDAIENQFTPGTPGLPGLGGLGAFVFGGVQVPPVKPSVWVAPDGEAIKKPGKAFDWKRGIGGLLLWEGMMFMIEADQQEKMKIAAYEAQQNAKIPPSPSNKDNSSKYKYDQTTIGGMKVSEAAASPNPSIVSIISYKVRAAASQLRQLPTPAHQ